MRLFDAEMALIKIKGNLEKLELDFMTVEDAWEILRSESPIDYGSDLKAWENWVYKEYTSLREAARNSEDPSSFRIPR